MTQLRAALPLCCVVVSVAMGLAACGGGAPGSGPVAEQEQLLPAPGKKNLVLEAGGAGLARLRVDVSGPDLKGIIRYDLPARDGSVVAGIGVPIGSRTIAFSAFDAAGRVTHSGRAVAQIRDGVTLPLTAELMGSGAEDTIHALLGSYRVELIGQTVKGKDGDIRRFTGRLLDPDGAPVPVDPKEVRWELDPGGWPNPPKLFPCPPLDSGGAPLCAELHPPLRFKPEIVLCLKDFFCRKEWQDKEYNIVAISAGWLQHACMVASWGAAYCWGGNGSGQLGASTTKACTMWDYTTNQGVPYSCSKVPVEVNCGGASCTFTTISAGASHTCALDRNQEIWCWGGDFAGQLGQGTGVIAGGTNPVKVTGGLKFTDVSAGRYYTCGLTTTQDVYCWGDNSAGAVGAGTGQFIRSPSKIALANKFTAISAGGDHACAVDTAGLMFCWGLNNVNQLNGSPAATPPSWCGNCSTIPLQVQGGGVAAMQGKIAKTPAAGTEFTCAIVTTGETICWGSISKGNAGGLPATPPVQWLSAGWSHACFITGGAGRCWGFNNNGELGNGQFTPINPNAPLSLTPVAVQTPPPGFYRIDGGIAFTCGISSDKEKVYCWGINGYGQLGDGTLTARNAPTKIVF